MDFWNKAFKNKKISLDIFDQIFDKKIKIIDRHDINGSDWFLYFKLENNKYINVTEYDKFEKEICESKCEFIPMYDEDNANLLILVKEGSNNPYTWMIKKLETQNYEVWVGGQGGAMNFEMILD